MTGGRGCKFGRTHSYARRPGTELDECWVCGHLSYDSTLPEAPGRYRVVCDGQNYLCGWKGYRKAKDAHEATLKSCPQCGAHDALTAWPVERKGV